MPAPRPPLAWGPLAVFVAIIAAVIVVVTVVDIGEDGLTTDRRNARAFIQDNLWTGADGRQHAVWLDGEANVVFGHRATPDDEWTIVDLAALPDNPLAAPVADDPHNVSVLGVDGRGNVHIAANMHNDQLRYVRTETPGSFDRWVSPTMAGETTSVTYPQFVSLPDGTLLFFRRQGGPDRSAILVDRLGPDAKNWESLEAVVDGRPDEGVYLHRVAVDPDDGTIHIFYVRRPAPRPSSNVDLRYLRSGDGGRTWTGTDRVARPAPRDPMAGEAVIEGQFESQEPLNSGGAVVDGAGLPHAVVRADDTIVHVHWTGATWSVEEVPGGLDGRPALGRDPTGRVWLVGARAGEVRIRLLAPELGEEDRGPRIGRNQEPTLDSAAMARNGTLQFLLVSEQRGAEVQILDLQQ